MRKISYSLYILALVITIIIFGAGVLIGQMYSNNVKSDIGNQLDYLSARTDSLQVLLLLSQQPSENLCGFYEKQAGLLGEQTADLGYKLGILEKNNDAQLIELKKLYFEKEIRDYLILSKIKSLCKKDFNLILYFYSNKNCPNCIKQGEELTKLKQSNPVKNLIYSLDYDSDSLSILAMKANYEITSTPSIVVNEKVYSGLNSFEQLKQLAK